MAIKRIVPSTSDDSSGMYTFADGARQLPVWERLYLDDATVFAITKETIGESKALRDLTYQQWLDKVFAVMQVRNSFVGAVVKQRANHFRQFS